MEIKLVCPSCSNKLKSQWSVLFGGYYVKPCFDCYERRPTKDALDLLTPRPVEDNPDAQMRALTSGSVTHASQ